MKKFILLLTLLAPAAMVSAEETEREAITVEFKNGSVVIDLQDSERIEITENTDPVAQTVASPDVLFIVDGIKTDVRTARAVPLDKIESITILKDPASTAVYGYDGPIVVVETTQKKSSRFFRKLLKPSINL